MANDPFITKQNLIDALSVQNDIYSETFEQILKSLEQHAEVEPANDDLPILFISGPIPTSKQFVRGEIDYISPTDSFHAYTKIKLQGNSTLSWPKKNYTIEFYQDENRTIPLKYAFKNWGKHNNFVLKADYLDILHARNVVAAKLWGKVVESRADYDGLPDGLKNSPNNGAVDGFPIKVYINGEYVGLYSFTIPKCDWMVGMDNHNRNHVLLSSEFNDNGNVDYEYNPCNFNDFWDGDSKYFKVEIGLKSAALIDCINAVIAAVIDGDVDALAEVLDIQSVIDYYIFQEIILGVDGISKNMLLATYDMHKWYLGAYDMDSTFDLSWDGTILHANDVENPWDLFLAKYNYLLNNIIVWGECSNDFRARYIELRKSVLSYDSIMAEFENYINIFGEDVYIQDTIAYPDIPNVTDNTLHSLGVFVKNWLQFLDNENEVTI